MLIFNEGVPGAGKSYDAVAEHIVPALKKGRRVYARLNGLDDAALAAFCEISIERVQELLVRVSSERVASLFVAVREGVAGETDFVLPPEFRNALIVIDEVHEFYVASRQPLPKEVEQFFAVHRHYGADIILITQWYKRLHTAIRARIERKNVFQKLTAVGMENSYRVTFYQTVQPDKYEKIGGETRKYNPAVFALYRGVASDEVQTEVYKGGAKTVWAQLKWPGIVMAVVLVAGVYFVWKFFSGGVSMFADEPAPVVESAPAGEGQFFQPDESAPVPPPVAPPPPDPRKGMTPAQRYVFDLVDKGRARTSTIAGEGPEAWGLIEFREANKPPSDVLTTRQLQSMGFKVTPTDYGFLLEAAGQTIVATQWPTYEVVRPNNHELYRLDKGEGGGLGASASEASRRAETVAGVRTPPESVGSPRSGEVWGRQPETLRAGGF